MLRSLFAAIALAGLSSCICPKASETLQPSVNNLKWVDLFNGKDMSGWVPVNVKPDTATVKDGMIFISGEPTGVIRSERKYTNFVLEYEWMHTVSQGNSGVFICADPRWLNPISPIPSAPSASRCRLLRTTNMNKSDLLNNAAFCCWGMKREPMCSSAQ